VVFQEVNAGFGAVDPHLYPPAAAALYPLQTSFLQDKAPCTQAAHDGSDALQTTQRLSYGPRCVLAAAGCPACMPLSAARFQRLPAGAALTRPACLLPACLPLQGP
jgi:hypothetical protein